MGDGRLFPVKAAAKDDKVGIGFVERAGSGTDTAANGKKVQKLDAGKVRKLYGVQKKRAAQLNRLFYANDDVVRYLGENG